MELRTKGQAIGPTGMVIFAITVIVGVIVFGGFETAAGTIGLGTAATAAVSNVTLNTYSGFKENRLNSAVSGLTL